MKLGDSCGQRCGGWMTGNGEGGVECNDRSYACIETTGEGWAIGDLPEEYEDEQIQIFDFR